MFQPAAARKAPAWARPRNFIIALVLILVVAALGLLSLQRYSESQYSLALRTDELGIAAYDLSGAASRVALTYQALPPNATLETAGPAAADASTARILLARSLIRFNTSAHATQDLPLLESLDHFAESVRQLQIAVQDQRISAIQPLAGAVDDEFVPLAGQIRDSSKDYADNARRAQTYALLGRLAVFVSAGAVIGLTYWRYHAVRHAAQQAMAEQELLRSSEARFRPLVQSSTDVISLLNADYAVTYASPAIERIAGLRPENVIGHPLTHFIAAEDRGAFFAFLDRSRRRPGEVVTAEQEFTLSGEKRVLELVCTNRLADPDVAGFVLNVRDVTERRQLEQQLRFQALHDALTGLANGRLFGDRLEQALLRTSRSGRGEVSVIFMDLDRFKDVNDEFGHLAGDELLKEVGARLNASIRASDTAARLGGDEFAILIDDVNGASNARDIADRVYTAMARPFFVGENEVKVSASIGVIVAEPETMSAGDVLRYADLAMYDAKHHGRNRVHHFKAAMLLALSNIDALAEREQRTAVA